ncbi:MAG TPA: GNAT family N-acetyltransferase [Terriglobales bacterium]|nr:GNAT family N-acetyltransferase [Terriglobales bacterium]
MPFPDAATPYEISSEPGRLDLDVIHEFLATAYWSPGIPREIVAQAMRNSVCFGAYAGQAQVGFARVVTDRTTFAYLADVFVLPEHRGRGLSKRLMQAVRSHPDLQGLRRWLLVTRDAHGLYRQFGFAPIAAPARHMEILDPEIYLRSRDRNPA